MNYINRFKDIFKKKENTYDKGYYIIQYNVTNKQPLTGDAFEYVVFAKSEMDAVERFTNLWEMKAKKEKSHNAMGVNQAIHWKTIEGDVARSKPYQRYGSLMGNKIVV